MTTLITRPPNPLDKSSCKHIAYALLDEGLSRNDLLAEGWDAGNLIRVESIIQYNHPNAESVDDIDWEKRRYLPGCGMLGVWWRVRCDGVWNGNDLWLGYEKRDHPEFFDAAYQYPMRHTPNHREPIVGSWGVRFHNNQRIVMPGETAIVVSDNGWDMRYTMRMDIDGMKVRGGPGRWSVVGNAIYFRHERGIIVKGEMVTSAVTSHDDKYVVIHVPPATMIQHGLDKERRHRTEGMTRHVSRNRIVQYKDVPEDQQ